MLFHPRLLQPYLNHHKNYTFERFRSENLRCQFSSRNLPLVGDRKYSTHEDNCEIALWSSLLRFNHPKTGETLTFTALPPDEFPWNTF